MIAAKVKLTQPPILDNRWIDESPINVWLIRNVGTNSRFIEQVDESRPWHVEHTITYLEYSFARDKDAVLFALKWL